MASSTSRRLRALATAPRDQRGEGRAQPVTVISSEMVQKRGPIPDAFTLGDGIGWESELLPPRLTSRCPLADDAARNVMLSGSDGHFTLTLRPLWSEVHVAEVLVRVAALPIQEELDTGQVKATSPPT